MVKVSKYLLLDGLRMGCKLADAKQKGCVNNGFEREVAGEGYLIGSRFRGSEFRALGF